MIRSLRVPVACAWMVLVMSVTPAAAEVEMKGRGVFFYTDDVGIFSASRRLSRDGDPTQPAIDSTITNQGSDVIFEPDLTLSTSLDNRYGKTTLSAKGQGFLYTDHTRYTHGTLRLEALQAFTPATRLRTQFYYAPDMFLGNNDNRQPGAVGLTREVLSSYIWAARIERMLTPDVEIRMLTRYGLRRYNADFEQRNTDFWTVGPHLEWRVMSNVKIGLGYHYERGLADGRNQPQLKEDVSYVNHYGSADLEVGVTDRLSVSVELDYERNNWTSGLIGDPRRGAHENVFQGDAVFYYRLDGRTRVGLGVQRSSRKESFESSAVTNTNVGVGIESTF